jgi:hypothetical protein
VARDELCFADCAPGFIKTDPSAMLGYVCADFGAGPTWAPAAIGLTCTGEVGMRLHTEYRNMVFIYNGTVHLLKAESPARYCTQSNWRVGLLTHCGTAAATSSSIQPCSGQAETFCAEYAGPHNSNTAAVESVL